LLIAACSYSFGLLVAANDPDQAVLPGLILAGGAPAIQVFLLAASIALLKPAWQRAAGRWLWSVLLLMAALPAILAVLDARLGTRLWYTGVHVIDYGGGFLTLDRFTTGSLSPAIHTASFRIFPALTLLALFYFAFGDRQLARSSRRLARLLFLVTALGQVLHYLFNQRMAPGSALLLPITLYAGAYAYAGFQQMVSERRLQRGSLQARLTALSMVVTIPLLIAVSIFVTDQAGALLEQSELHTLRANNRTLAFSVDHWLQAKARELQQ